MPKLLQDMSIGNNLQQIRKKFGYKQTEIVSKMQLKGSKISRTEYVKIESGKRNIKISDLVALQEIYCISYDAFFNGLSTEK